ncbi:DUF2913 family protein [Morganella morganii]|nr:DUF2913 family protein [Morganella morganii]
MSQTITAKVGHMAWCALVAMHIARHDGKIHSETQKNLFLIRWLATAQKQRRFCKEVAIDITWLIKQGRTLGMSAKLPQKLEYLYRSCTGKLSEQTDLFRLTYALETTKEQGFYYQLLSEKEWSTRYQTIHEKAVNAIYLTKSGLDNAFDGDGQQIATLWVKISGNISEAREILSQSGWHCREQPDTTGTYALLSDQYDRKKE